MSALPYLRFYLVFILFTTYIGTTAGITIFQNVEGIDALVPTSALDLVNPVWFIGSAWALFNLSSEFALLYTIIIAPFFVIMAYIIAALVRGVSP